MLCACAAAGHSKHTARIPAAKRLFLVCMPTPFWRENRTSQTYTPGTVHGVVQSWGRATPEEQVFKFLKGAGRLEADRSGRSAGRSLARAHACAFTRDRLFS